jgi:hypothetical protein
MAVTFISHGYDTTTGNPYTEIAWADAHPAIGSGTYGVRSGNDWKVTAVAGQDRTVSIAEGFGWGAGVIDLTVENETIQLDTISSGSRWDLIAARRDWTPTAGETKFMKINGGSTRAIPGGRLMTPGGIDDQPLALVQVTAGQTQPTAIVDLRCWATNGGMVAKDDLAKNYLNKLGTEVFINGVEWRYIPGDNDVPTWIGNEVDKTINGGLHVGLTALQTGWTRPFTAGNSKPRVWSTDGITAHMTGMVQFNAGGGAPIIGIPADFAPTATGTLTYVGTTQASNGPSDTAAGATIALGIENGILKIIYQSKTVAVGSYVPLTGTWLISG